MPPLFRRTVYFTSTKHCDFRESLNCIIYQTNRHTFIHTEIMTVGESYLRSSIGIQYLSTTEVPSSDPLQLNLANPGHMDTKTNRTKKSSVRLPQKEALHRSNTPPKQLATCGACDSFMPEGATTCLACGVSMPTILSFSADREIIRLGEPIRLSWDVENAEAVWLEDGTEILPLFGQEDVYPMASTTYVLIAESAAGQVEQKISLTLPAPDIQRFEVDSRQIELNYPTIFSWDASNAEVITIEPGIGEVSGLSFCEKKVRKPGVYELKVQNASGEARAKVFLTLSKPEIDLFTILQDHVEPGEPHLLHWEVENADQLILLPDGIDVSGQTQVEVFPDRSTTYRLLAENAAGEVEETAFIPLPEPKIQQFASPQPISTEGKSIELEWDVKYAYRVEIEPEIGEVEPSGKLTYKPTKAFTEFTIRATGYSGVTSASTTVSRFPLPLDDFNENQLFREIGDSIKEHEKMLRKHANEISSARFLPEQNSEPLPDDLLKSGSVKTEMKRVLKNFFSRSSSSKH